MPRLWDFFRSSRNHFRQISPHIMLFWCRLQTSVPEKLMMFCSKTWWTWEHMNRGACLRCVWRYYLFAHWILPWLDGNIIKIVVSIFFKGMRLQYVLQESNKYTFFNEEIFQIHIWSYYLFDFWSKSRSWRRRRLWHLAGGELLEKDSRVTASQSWSLEFNYRNWQQVFSPKVTRLFNWFLAKI